MAIDNSDFNLLHSACLSGVLAVAVYCDLKSRRIPNRLILAGLALALFCNGVVAPPSQGLDGPLGWGPCMAGAAVGLGTLLPLYGMGAMGAGDVKLMAVVGAFLGPSASLGAALATLVAGGFLAVAAALHWRVAPAMLRNVKTLLASGVARLGVGDVPQFGEVRVSAGRLPCAVAIAGDTAASWA